MRHVPGHVVEIEPRFDEESLNEFTAEIEGAMRVVSTASALLERLPEVARERFSGLIDLLSDGTIDLASGDLIPVRYTNLDGELVTAARTGEVTVAWCGPGQRFAEPMVALRALRADLELLLSRHSSLLGQASPEDGAGGTGQVNSSLRPASDEGTKP